MKINLRHVNAQESWKITAWAHNNYHTKLKQFGYKYNNFVPNDKRIHEFMEIKKPTPEQIKYYRNLFINEIYKESDLTRLDATITNDVIPNMLRAIEKQIVPLLASWNAQLPEHIYIQCEYGLGGAYAYGRNPGIILRMSEFQGNQYGLLNICLHEFVHILIEEPIIKKYNIPHNIKERIVDIICLELFNKPVQTMFENSFANTYITPEVIRTDLIGAVKKMMTEYNAMLQIQNTKDK